MIMLEKQLIKKVHVNDLQMESKEFDLEYYLTYDTNNVYGVEIKKMDRYKQEGKHIFDIERNKQATIGIINELANNQVTPITFEDVIDDYFARM